MFDLVHKVNLYFFSAQNLYRLLNIFISDFLEKKNIFFDTNNTFLFLIFFFFILQKLLFFT